jgi:hypothetical protein
MRRSPSAGQFLTIEVHQVLAGQDGERLGSVVMYMHGRPEAVRFALGPQEGELTGGIGAGGQHGGAEAAEIQIPFPVRGARPVRASVNRGSRPAHDEARSVACRRPRSFLRDAGREANVGGVDAVGCTTPGNSDALHRHSARHAADVRACDRRRIVHCGRRSDLRSRLPDVPHDGVSIMRACDGIRLVEHCERIRAAVLGRGNVGQPDHVKGHIRQGPYLPDQPARLLQPLARLVQPASRVRRDAKCRSASDRVGLSLPLRKPGKRTHRQ